MNVMKVFLEKYRKIPITLKASIWFIFCNLLLKGISFFTSPMFARLLSTEEYGKMTLFASYEQIVLIIATWEIGLSPTQRGLLKYKESRQIYRSSVILFSMITSFIVSCVVILFRREISDFTEMPGWLLFVMALYTFVYTSYSSWMTENKLSYNYRTVSIVTVGMTVLQIASALLAVCCIKPTADIKLLFTLMPAIVVSLFILAFRFKPHILIKSKNETKDQLHFIFSFAWPLVLHSLSFLVLGQADRIMIGKMVGNSEAGLYGVSYTISSVVIIVQNAVLQVLSPWIYHRMDAKEYDKINKLMTGILTLVCVVYVAFILVAPDVIILMYPEYYWEGIWCIPPISMGVFFMFMYSLFVAVEECLDQTKYVAYVSITCALINVVLNYFGIKLFGYIACAYTTLICYILFAIGHYYFMSKIVKEKVGSVKVYNGRLFLLSSIAMSLFMGCITLIYNSRFMRYLIVSIILLICFVFRNRITKVVNNLKNKN